MTSRPSLTLLALLTTLVLAGCGNEGEGESSGPATGSESSAAEATESPAETSAGDECRYQADGSEPAKPVTPPAEEPAVKKDVPAVVKTNVGTITVKLKATTAPCTVNSFVALAEQDYFDKTQCHRLTTDGIWVLQCGDPTATGSGGPGYAFDDELSGKESYPAGTVAMANAGPGTNGSQFFLVYKDSLGLPANYTVFGTMDAASIRVVQKVAGKGTVEGAPDGSPKQEVEITSVTVR
ncbi:MAG: peptidylprolyl isomerase [Nocardioides sp.]